MDEFLGFVTLEGTLVGTLFTRNGSGTPTDATGNPSYRVYGSSGLMNSGSGSFSTFRDSGTITAATNASPIAITSANHGLNDGTQITISGVLGNTAANGTFVITRTGSNTFTLGGSTGNGAYTSGGTWHVSGAYTLSFVPSAANGFAAGSTYTMLVTATVSGTVKGYEFTFTVT